MGASIKGVYVVPSTIGHIEVWIVLVLGRFREPFGRSECGVIHVACASDETPFVDSWCKTISTVAD